MTARPDGHAGWDQYGERIVARGVCVFCGENIDEWEIRIEPETRVRRPVLLWKAAELAQEREHPLADDLVHDTRLEVLAP